MQNQDSDHDSAGDSETHSDDSASSAATDHAGVHRISVSEPRIVAGTLAFNPSEGACEDLVQTEVDATVPGQEDVASYSCLCGEEFGNDFPAAVNHLNEMLAHGHDVEPVAGTFETLPYNTVYNVLETVRESPSIGSHEEELLNAVHALLQEIQSSPEEFEHPDSDS